MAERNSINYLNSYGPPSNQTSVSRSRVTDQIMIQSCGNKFLLLAADLTNLSQAKLKSGLLSHMLLFHK